jgi:hypothetical protein
MSDRIEQLGAGRWPSPFTPPPPSRSIDATIDGKWLMSNLIERLIAAHRVLNREIRRELARRVPDSLRLRR